MFLFNKHSLEYTRITNFDKYKHVLKYFEKNYFISVVLHICFLKLFICIYCNTAYNILY